LPAVTATPYLRPASGGCLPIRAPILIFASLTTLAAAAAWPKRPATRFSERGRPGDLDQIQQWQPAHGAFLRGGSLPIGDVRTTCPALEGPDTSDISSSPHGDTLFTASCELSTFDTLDPGVRAQWATATYRHHYIYSHDTASEDTAATRDTVTIDDAVLYRIGSDRMLRPMWHDTYDRRETWELDLTAARHPAGILFSLQYCVNGTGGCHQYFMLRHDGVWADVTSAFLNQLPPSMHDSFWKGIRIDVHTLHAEAPLYRETDANCCPSRHISMDLGLRGDSLVLRSYRAGPSRDSTSR
jgi:hypothetical protein